MAHNHLVQRFRVFFLWYEETRNTSGQYWVLHSTEYHGITYDVCSCVSMRRLPFEEHLDTKLKFREGETGDCF